jgi:hypothetical protein
VLLQGSTRILIYIDGLLSVAPNCACCYLISSIFPERSIALVNDWLVHQKELKLIPTCPTLTKCYQGSTRILIYIDDFFQSHQTVPKPLLSLPSSIFSRTFNCTSKTTGWFTKRSWNWSQPAPLKKCYSKVAHAFLYTLIDTLSIAPNCAQAVAILPSSIFPERSIALVKRLHQKELNWSQPAPR